MGENGMGVTVTLREIYDAVQRGAEQSSGARRDVAALRQDFQTLDKRLAAVEQAQKASPGGVTLKQAAAAAGVIAAAVASAWGTAHGVG